jgi:tryptophan 7-halogenase
LARFCFKDLKRSKNMTGEIKSVVILGGGTAGWMTAAALARFVVSENTKVTLVESDTIGTVGVGEATIPHIRVFNELLGIDEAAFMKQTNATYKLGIRFSGWGNKQSEYYHPFGDHGFPIDGIGFHHYWLAAKQLGINLQSFDSFSMANVLAREKKFTYPSADPDHVLSTFSYAYHIDASAYAAFLRSYSESKGINRIEGDVTSIMKNSETGFVESLMLASGISVEGDLFIDCSGFRSIILGRELGVEFQSWKHWLPCDSALAVPTENESEILPYTRSTAKSAGWCWQIPLMHRMGNGHVFSSEFTNPQDARDELWRNLSTKPLRDPALIKFEAGIRQKSWDKNCVAVGLACGFLEPLESTSIYLIEVAILKLLELFPVDKNYGVEENEFNRQMENEYLKIRDFIILHYAINQRSEDFWRYCANMSLPSSLQEKVDVFKSTAQIVEYDSGLFMPPSWLAVYLGQNLLPSNWDSRLTHTKIKQAESLLKQIPEHLTQIANRITAHNMVLAKSQQPAAQMSLYGVRR